MVFWKIKRLALGYFHMTVDQLGQGVLGGECFACLVCAWPQTRHAKHYSKIVYMNFNVKIENLYVK